MVILVNCRVIWWSYYCSRHISPGSGSCGPQPWCCAHPARWAPSPRWRRTGASCAARRGCGTPGQRTASPPRCCHRPACPRPRATSSSAPPHAPPLQTPGRESRILKSYIPQSHPSLIWKGNWSFKALKHLHDTVSHKQWYYCILQGYSKGSWIKQCIH